MQPALAVAGLALIALAAGDAIATAIRVGRRGGPVTRLVAGVLWRALSKLRRPQSRRAPLSLAGLLVTLAVIFFWIMAMVTGWFLVFSSAPDSILEPHTDRPASGWARLNFAASMVFGGSTDLRPSAPLWQACSWGASGSGLMLISLFITYLILLSTAVSQKRQLARVISAFGRTPADILVKGWSERNFKLLQDWLISLTPMLARLVEHHHTFPMLHFFHTADRDAAVGPSIAVLNDAILLLSGAVSEQVRPSDLALDPPRTVIATLLSTIPEAYLHTAAEPPPEPHLGALDHHGIPHQPPDEINAAFAGAAYHRRRLLSLVLHEGWTWQATTAEGVPQGEVADPS